MENKYTFEVHQYQDYTFTINMLINGNYFGSEYFMWNGLFLLRNIKKFKNKLIARHEKVLELQKYPIKRTDLENLINED